MNTNKIVPVDPELRKCISWYTEEGNPVFSIDSANPSYYLQGHNCRAQGFSVRQAEDVVESSEMTDEDIFDFFDGYWNTTLIHRN